MMSHVANAVARLTAIIESAPMAIVMIDAAGRIVLTNKEAEVLFGYHRDELLGQPVDLLVPVEFRASHPAARTSFFLQPTPRRMGAGRDLFAQRKDGSRFPVEIGLNPIDTDEGLFVLRAIVDTTERKRLEDRFRAAVESAPTAMVMINSAGSIIITNAETEKLFGYQRSELLGQLVEILIPMRFGAAHPGLRGQFFIAPEARNMGGNRDLFGLRKDGSEFPIEIGLNPIDTDEGLFKLSAINNNTKRKELEKALRQTNELLEQRAAERTAQLAARAGARRRAGGARGRGGGGRRRGAY